MTGETATVDAPDCVPARMVNEFSYCPRLAYIEWVQGDFADNFETVDGRYAHRAVDREGGRLPPGRGVPAPQEDGEARDESDRAVHARSVWLSAPSEHLTAKSDLIEGATMESVENDAGAGRRVTPVDYKRGKVPDTPERCYEPERVQLCCQALVLRANGYECGSPSAEGSRLAGGSGVIYYVASKTRVEVPFTDELVARTRELVRELRRVASSGEMPPPLDASPKCVRCSLAGICLPDETNMLSSGRDAGSAEDDGVRRILPARDDSAPLYVQEQGARVSKRGDVFEVVSGKYGKPGKSKKETLGEARVFETSQIALFGNAQITTQALGEAFARGIPVAFFSTGGWFRGIAHGMSHKNVELRCRQYAAAADAARSLGLARTFVAAKIDNCRTLVMRNHPGPRPHLADDLARLASDARAAQAADSLLGIEGMAAKMYFSAFEGMLKASKSGSESEWRFDFTGRNRRPPLDPVNAMLSYAYSLLAKDLAVTALAVGFDPLLGFYHRPRYGRPALALDLMEELRPIVADSVVLWVVNNGVLSPGDFVRRGPAAAMRPAARRKFIDAYEKRLDSLVTHPVFGYRISYRRVLEVQARLLGRVLLGEIAEYPAFRTR